MVLKKDETLFSIHKFLDKSSEKLFLYSSLLVLYYTYLISWMPNWSLCGTDSSYIDCSNKRGSWLVNAKIEFCWNGTFNNSVWLVLHHLLRIHILGSVQAWEFEKSVKNWASKSCVKSLKLITYIKRKLLSFSKYLKEWFAKTEDKGVAVVNVFNCEKSWTSENLMADSVSC